MSKTNQMTRLKPILIAALAILTIPVSAQIKKGTRMVGVTAGTVVYNSGSSDVSFAGTTAGYSTKVSSWGVNIVPSIGYFINERMAIGFNLNINPSGSKTSFQYGTTTFQQDKVNGFIIGAGGFIRNYFKSGSTWLPFGQFGLNAGTTTQKTSGFFYGGSGPGAYKDTYTGKSSSGFFANASFTLGLTRLLSAHTGFDVSAGYMYSYNKYTYKTTRLRDDAVDGTIDQTSVNNPSTNYTNHGLTLNIGFQIFLDPHK